jgi:CheY-like chemotaxis protein
VQRAAAEAAAAEEAAGAEGLPSGIPTSPHAGMPPPSSLRAQAAVRRASGESGSVATGRGASGSRRQSMESDLSSMWLSHQRPTHGDEDTSMCYPRHALSWEHAPQPPSFTAAEMLQAMPLAPSPGLPTTALTMPRRPGQSRPAPAGGLPHLGGGRHGLPQAGGAASGPVAGQGGAGSRSLSGLRVLLAEDNLINQTVAKRVLTLLGCECHVASNGREAVAVSRRPTRCAVPAPLLRPAVICSTCSAGSQSGLILLTRCLLLTLHTSPLWRLPLLPCCRLSRRALPPATPLTSSSWTCACQCWGEWRPRRWAAAAAHCTAPRVCLCAGS